MKRNSLLFLAASLVSLPALAGDDFGLRTEAGVQKDVTKTLSVDASLEFRAEDKLRQPARWAVGVGAAYKPVKYFSLGVGYSFIHDYSFQESEAKYKEDDDGNLVLDNEGQPQVSGYNVDHGYWRNKHRATLDVTGKLPLGRFTLSLRERYQYTHFTAATINRTRYRSLLDAAMVEGGGWQGDYYEYAEQYFGKCEVVEKDKAAKDRHYLRSRLQLEYNIRHCPWTPYASVEFSNNLTDGLHLDKTRYTLGAEWKITKQHRLDFAYLYEDGADDDTRSNCHALCIGYKFKF